MDKDHARPPPESGWFLRYANFSILNLKRLYSGIGADAQHHRRCTHGLITT